MKSRGGSRGTSGGLQRSCVGVAAAVERSNSPTRRAWAGLRGWKGSWVTDGLIRYSHLQRKKKLNLNLMDDGAVAEAAEGVRAQVLGPRGGEGGAGELLGVEAPRAHQRAVLADGERPRHRLRREGVAQPGEVAQLLLLLRGHGCCWACDDVMAEGGGDGRGKAS